MPKLKTSFAKIVGTPTDTAWSQAYSAGDLYAVIALTKKDTDEELSLNVLGKGILNNIEAEFFTLEEKTLANIKSAVQSALTSTPDSIHVHLALCFIKGHVAYLFVIGETKIQIKRAGQIATILAGTVKKGDERTIHAASGMLKPNDTLILLTDSFSDHLPEKVLTTALESPSVAEAEEALMPRVHAEKVGDAGALLIQAHSAEGADIAEESGTEESPEPTSPTPPDAAEEKEEPHRPIIEEEARENRVMTDASGIGDEESEKPLRRMPKMPDLSFLLSRFGQRRTLFLALALILAVAFIGSILMVNTNREQAKTSAEFQKVYDSALKDYDLGVSLEELNKSVALDNFRKAQQTIDANKEKFKEGTEERKKLNELAAKIQEKVGGSGDGQSVSAKAVAEDSNPLLLLQKTLKTPFVATAEDKFFFLNSDGVFETDAKGEDKNELYENNDDWSDIAGIGAFGSNVYALDRKEGVLKFVAGSEGYGKQGYFQGDSPNLANAADMTIDGSVWILMKDGTILKYNRGEKESFAVSALPKPLSNPAKIVTSEESDNLYILDRGNSRVVVLDKSGTFKNAYSVNVASNASGMAINETDKKLYLLSDGKTYEISM